MKFLIFFIYFSSNLFAEESVTSNPSNISPEAISRINNSYLAKIKPLFKRACFDCHSDTPEYPWYHSIPGIKQLMDHHIAEGVRHLDLSKDYPFKGSKKGLKHDLEEIWETIDEGEMAPLYYRIMHSHGRYSAEDKLIIKTWVEESLKEFTP
jgi:hypothetical protein